MMANTTDLDINAPIIQKTRRVFYIKAASTFISAVKLEILPWRGSMRMDYLAELAPSSEGPTSFGTPVLASH